LLKLLSDNKNTKYTDNWFESASDDQLETEREKVRQEYCSSGDNYSLAVGLEKLLWKFDDVTSERAWNGSNDYGYSKHREHGWYLSNDDK
jgi:hypothetical protein